MNNTENIKDKKRSIKLTFISIFVIAIGIFLFVTFLAFKPEYSIYNARSISEINHHIFGIFGLSISSFIFRYIGYSSYILAFSFLYTGYLILSKKKNILVYLSIPFWIFEIFLFCTILSIDNSKLKEGGGELGRFLVISLFKDHFMLVKLISIFIAVVSITLVLYKPFLKKLVYAFAKIFKLSIRKNRTKESVRRKNRSDIEILPKSNALKSKRKLPFIKKIYYYDGDIIDAEKLREGAIKGNFSTTCNSNKKLENINKNPEEEYIGNSSELLVENGQYILPVVSDKKEKPQIKQGSRDDSLCFPKLNGSMLKKSTFSNKKEQERETQKKAKELERTLQEFGIEARVTGVIRGPVITRYEIQPAPGVKLNRIVNLSDNIALNLSAKGVRIEAPIPGRSAVGIEVPNEYREIVMLGDILDRADSRGELPLVLGKDVSGKIVVSDLSEMPHLLIAGATGSGKSVCVNSLILSLLFKKSPEEVKFIMIDPKMVELKIYNGIPHLLTEVVTDPRHAAKALRWVIFEMENRYKMLDEYKVRDIKGYNKKASKKIPYIVVIIDEFANLMAISQKDVEDAVVRLAAMSRAVGIHIIMATQRPSVDVITGLIKANFPYRIAFQVASKTDSRTILDTIGAEKLLGRGDMLFSPAGSMNLIRIQGAYVSEEEVISVVKELKKRSEVEYLDIFDYDEQGHEFHGGEDPLFDEAVDIVIKTRRASASFLQRRLKIGYNRAARLIEIMEEKGIIGPPRGSKPREIFIDSIDKLNKIGD